MTAIARSSIRVSGPPNVVKGWEVTRRRSTASLVLSDITPLAKVLIKSDANSRFAANHKTAFGRARMIKDGVLEIGCDPGTWLWVGSIGSAEELMMHGESLAASSDELITVIDLTHGRALMRLSGADSNRLLNKLCAINLSDVATPNLSTFRSNVAKLVADVVRDDLANSTQSYLIHCERSSGQYLFDCILDAGSEFGIEIDGADFQ